MKIYDTENLSIELHRAVAAAIVLEKMHHMFIGNKTKIRCFIM